MKIKHSVVAAAAVTLLSGTAGAQDTELHYSGWIDLYPHHAAVVEYLESEFERRNPGVDWVKNDVAFDQALKQATVATLGDNAPDNIHLIAGWVPAIHGNRRT